MISYEKAQRVSKNNFYKNIPYKKAEKIIDKEILKNSKLGLTRIKDLEIDTKIDSQDIIERVKEIIEKLYKTQGYSCHIIYTRWEPCFLELRYYRLIINIDWSKDYVPVWENKKEE